jgi:hypothetical protein
MRLGLLCVLGGLLAGCGGAFSDASPSGQDDGAGGVDASSHDSGGAAKWDTGLVPCSPECPFPRPRVGTACTFSTSTVCTYEECAYGQQCENGVWQPVEEGCAVAN